MAKRLLYISPGGGPHDRRFIQAAEVAGLEVVAIQVDPQSAGGSPAAGLIPASRPSTVNALQREIESIRPNLIQVGPLGRLTRAVLDETSVPVLATSWGFDLLDPQHPPGRDIQLSLEGAAWVLVDCQSAAQVVRRLCPSGPRLSVIPWGTDLVRFSPKLRRAVRRKKTIVSLRSHEELYNLEVLIDALSLVRHLDLEVVIAGDGSHRSELESLVSGYGLDGIVTFVGRIPEPRVAQLLHAADLYVSTSQVDGSSVSLLQALACGLPCIVTDIPSNREWVDADVGWLVPVGEPIALARAVEEAVSEGTGLDERGKAARAVAEAGADWGAHRLELGRIYRSLAGG